MFPNLRRFAREGLEWGLKQLAKNGITSAVDARVYWGREHERAWDELEAQRRLTIKAVLSMWIYPEQTDDNAQIARLKTFYKRGVEVKITEAYPSPLNFSFQIPTAGCVETKLRCTWTAF